MIENTQKKCKICDKECIPSFILTNRFDTIYLCEIKCYKLFLNMRK